MTNRRSEYYSASGPFPAVRAKRLYRRSNRIDRLLPLRDDIELSTDGEKSKRPSRSRNLGERTRHLERDWAISGNFGNSLAASSETPGNRLNAFTKWRDLAALRRARGCTRHTDHFSLSFWSPLPGTPSFKLLERLFVWIFLPKD
jgi:hypothetical protein